MSRLSDHMLFLILAYSGLDCAQSHRSADSVLTVDALRSGLLGEARGLLVEVHTAQRGLARG